MLKFILRRAVYIIITLWLITTLTFILMKCLPGDPLGENAAKLTAAQKKILYAQYGLDKPVWQQYLKYIGNAARGDLGVSFQFPATTVVNKIKQGLPASLELAVWAALIAVAFGLTLGIIAALKHNKGGDYAAMITAVIGVSIPSFVLGPLLSYFIGVKLNWLPPGLWTGPESRVLPAIALSFGTLAIVARMMRTSMLDVLGQDYIKTAKSKGLSNRSVVFRHTLRNAIMPVITLLGPIFVNLITYAIVVEKIFSVPGLGSQLITAITSNDYTMIAGLTIFYSFLLVTVIFVTDILYGFIDPRIRLAKGRS